MSAATAGLCLLWGLGIGALAGACCGYLLACRDERRYRDRADARCRTLIAANDELVEFLAVIVPQDFEESA